MAICGTQSDAISDLIKLYAPFSCIECDLTISSDGATSIISGLYVAAGRFQLSVHSIPNRYRLGTADKKACNVCWFPSELDMAQSGYQLFIQDTNLQSR